MKPVMLNIQDSKSYIGIVAADVTKELPYLHDMTSRIEAHAHILSEAAWRRIAYVNYVNLLSTLSTLNP